MKGRPQSINYRKDGYGTSFYESEKVFYIGNWYEDEFHGYGEEYYLSGKLKYRGQYESGLSHGLGQRFTAVGTLSCSGVWNAGSLSELKLAKNFLKKGFKVAIGVSGNFFVAQFVDDKRHGYAYKICKESGQKLEEFTYKRDRKVGIKKFFAYNSIDNKSLYMIMEGSSPDCKTCRSVYLYNSIGKLSIVRSEKKCGYDGNFGYNFLHNGTLNFQTSYGNKGLYKAFFFESEMEASNDEYKVP